MSKIDFQQLNTLEGFKGFLSAYHSQLSETRSFPPLGLQKALHTAAPVFGYNDWHVMSAALQASAPAVSVESEVDRLAAENQIELVDLGDAWGWRSLNESIDRPATWPTKGKALADAFSYYGIKAELPVEAASDYRLEGNVLRTLDGRYVCELSAWDTSLFSALCSKAPAPVATEPERISVIVVTLIDKNADGGVEYVDNDLYRTWEEAKEHVAGILHNKVSGNDVGRDEWSEYSFISYPYAESMGEMDDQELLEWIVENNDIHSLCEFVEMVDQELTDLSCKETYL